MTVETPGQLELDTLALFAEAARELKQSPYFAQEHQNLSLHFKGGELVAAGFPDPQVRDALLVHFRRLWVANERSSFHKAIKTMKRYVPGWRVLLGQFHDRLKWEKANWGLLPPSISPVYSPGDTIDIWLKCRLMHSGMRGRTGRFTRADFDRATEAMGEVEFEYCFLVAVSTIGCVFHSVLPLAEDLLAHWNQAGYKPSLEAHAPAPGGVQHTARGVRVTRTSPGWSRERETPGQALTRLCRRREFEALGGFLERLPGDLAHKALALLEAESLDAFMIQIGTVYDEEDEPSEHDEAVYYSTVLELPPPVPGAPRVRKGLVTGLDSGKIVFAGEALPVLRGQYASLRPQLGNAIRHRAQ